jgi:uncharacterized protein (TIGR02266 family)
MYQQSEKTGQKAGNPEQVIAALAKHRSAIESRIKEIEACNRRLDAEEQQVGQDAAELESRICKLAEEEIRLQQRKKQLREEARIIGERRKSIQDRRRAVTDQMGNALEEVQMLEARRAEAEQQQAYNEAQKRASISRAGPAGMWDGRERRTCRRVAVEVDVSMHTEHNFYAGLSRDLSEGGLFIATMENLPVGTELDVVVSLPEHPPIRARGRVRWVREHNQFNQDFHPGVGVQFVELADSDRRAIERFLHTREPLFYDSELF